MAGYLCKTAAYAKRIRQKPLSEWPRIFERWLGSWPDEDTDLRRRLFPATTTFWLFFSPDDLRGLSVSGSGAKGHGLVVGYAWEKYIAEHIGLLPGEKEVAFLMVARPSSASEGSRRRGGD